MTLTLELSPTEERELQNRAARDGVSLDEYVRRRVFPSQEVDAMKKPFHVLQFAGAARPQKTAEEIDAIVAEIDASRDEWDRDDSWRQSTTTTDDAQS